MQKKLDIRAFFFNAKTDYLPYYKQFRIALTEGMKVKELLTLIKDQNENFTFPEEKLLLKINDLVVDGEQSVSEVVDKLGTSLQIDPVNSYRSSNGLVINDDDFMQRYELLAPFASEKDLEYYRTLYSVHYASETEKFDRDYIGDAVLLLAHKMITDGSEYKEAILEAITSVHSGLFDCEYENNFFDPQDHTAAIEELKRMVKPPQQASFTDRLAAGLAGKTNVLMKKDSKETVVDTEGKQIAYYAGSAAENTADIHKKIIQNGSKIITFSRANKRSGLSLLQDNAKLAYKKAATTLLDALDSGAEVLIVEEKDVYEMFTAHFNKIERTIGRDIDLALISAEDFMTKTHTAEV